MTYLLLLNSFTFINEEIMNEFRKPSYEAANRLVTRATQDRNVGYCVGNSNLVSEIF